MGGRRGSAGIDGLRFFLDGHARAPPARRPRTATPALKGASDVLRVTGDGTTIPSDPNDGWSFATTANGVGIQLTGTACASYKTGAIKTIDVEVPCSGP